MAQPQVKIFAEAHQLPVFQPERVRAPEFLQQFKQFAPDLVVVAAFGQILPKAILEQPRLGCINVHPSLLPKYRGAAPINWTIIRGETKTGVTIMQMDEGMDSGDILLQEETAIGPRETVGDLHDRLAELGAQMLIRTIEQMEAGTLARISQEHASATFAPRLKKEDGLIHWEADVHDIIRLIRGLSPSPGAYTLLDGKALKIFQAVGLDEPVAAPPGTIRNNGKELLIAAGNGSVALLDVQMEGKKRISIQDFLRGCRLRTGDRLG